MKFKERTYERIERNLMQGARNLLASPENRKILRFLYKQREYISKQIPPIVSGDIDILCPYKFDRGLQLLHSMEWAGRRYIERFNTLEYLSKRLKIDKAELEKRLERMDESNLVDSYWFKNESKGVTHFLMTEEVYEFLKDNFLKKDDSWEI